MAGLVITIDGPAASGKSTLAKLLAQKLGATFLDTGAMYRSVTVAAMRAGIPLTDDAAIRAMMDKTDFRFAVEGGKTKVSIDGRDVTEDIRRPDVTANTHYVASSPILRKRLVELQRQFAAQYDKIITEGRDQGTVAFPDACFKFFLTANEAERARRRQAELAASGSAPDIALTQEAIAARDRSDRTRSVGPLVPAPDAVTIDTTELTIDQVLNKMLETISCRLPVPGCKNTPDR
jgi:cytidylate kinase